LDILRQSEWICVVNFAFLALASFFFPIPKRRRTLIVVLNLSLGGLFLLLAGAENPTSPLFISVLRDWLPAPLILVAYHEAGILIFPRPNHRFEHALQGWDKFLFEETPFRLLHRPFPRWLEEYLEFCYLLCYPIVPAGLAGLYLARLGRFADEFWSVVLPAVFISYALSPFFASLPPRTLFPTAQKPVGASVFRRLNLWVLKRASIQANTFPSAHVAGVVATSLAVLIHLPTMGVVYMIIAVSIALASVRGRYHYAADAVLGALVGLGGYLVQLAMTS
jgi:hypothetical protein